ncbi:hypothetical protein ACXIZN_30235 [Amycolatopsis sp. TRM77291]
MTARIPQGNEGTNRARVRRNDRRQQPFPGRSMPVRRSTGVPRRRSY